MLYILTIKKHFNQKGTHPTLLTVKHYLNLYGRGDLLICWPGYLCTNVKTANRFYNKFPTPVSKGISYHNNPCFFFKGMNGNRNINGLTPAKKTVDYINGLYNGYVSSYGVNDDHSKIIAFCDMSKNCILANGSNIDRIIDDIANGVIKVKAMLIGSSNHSHNTLTKISPDKKGECDIFLFNVDNCDNDDVACSLYYNIMEENHNQNFSILLTKEVKSSMNLNVIFRNLIEK